MDNFDPCAAFRKLREAYLSYLGGEAPAVVEFEVGGGTRRRIEFHKANLQYIKEELARLEQECLKSQGFGPRKVIRGG